MSYAPLYGILGSAGNFFGGQFQQFQPGYSQQLISQQQLQQADLCQLQQQQLNYASLYGASLAQYRPPNVFVPLTQDEVDMAEAMYEVNKIAPGLREENQ